MRKETLIAVAVAGAVVLCGWWYGGGRNSRSGAAPAIERNADLPEPTGATPLYAQPSPRSDQSPQRKTRSDEETIPVQPGDAADVVARLRPLVEAGDARAALSIYMKLDSCKPQSQAGLRAEAVRNQTLFDSGIAVETLAAQQAQKRRECASAGEAVHTRGQWLQRAAAMGDERAQLIYSIDTDAVLGGPAEMLNDPDAVKRYRATAMNYLTRLSAQGNLSAMMQLAGVYSGGGIGPKDAVRSYAYYRAIDLARPGLIPPSLLESRRADVPRSEAAASEALATQIYTECCSRKGH